MRCQPQHPLAMLSCHPYKNSAEVLYLLSFCDIIYNMSKFEMPGRIQESIDDDLNALRAKEPTTPLDHVYHSDTVVDEIQSVVHAAYTLPDNMEITPVQPPKGIEADLAVPAFVLAPSLKKPPVVIANEVSKSFADDPDATPTIETLQAVGPYINVGLNREASVTAVVDDTLALGDRYGDSDAMAGQTRVIDYSSPNASKLMGFQHTRTTFVGESNARIQQANGADVIRTNYVGDYGKPTGKILLAATLYSLDLDGPDPVRQMNDLYVRIGREISADPALNDAADRFAARLEEGDPEVLSLWEKIRTLSVAENNALYDSLNIHFDTTIGESSFIHDAGQITDELLRRGIAIEDDGAVIVPADTVKGVTDAKTAELLMLRNSRGKTTYGSRDLAALKYRMDTYGASSVEYVVGAEQAGYLDAVFGVAALAGIIRDRDTVHHTRLGLLQNANGKKMSSRDGSAIPLIDEMAKKYSEAHASITARGVITDPREQEALAKTLGYGNIVYPIVSKDPTANIALGESGSDLGKEGTAGYVQYSHARAASVLRNLQEPLPRTTQLGAAPTEAEWRLTKAIMDLPTAVKKAGAEYSPAPIATSVETISSAFNTFYQLDSIRNAPNQEQRLARYALTQAAEIALNKGLTLLNVGAPNKM